MTEAEFRALLLKLVMNDPEVKAVSFSPQSSLFPDADPSLFDTKHAIYLINALAFNTHCKDLMIRNVPLGLEGAKALNRLVKTNQGLERLRLFNVQTGPRSALLGIDGIKIILEALKENGNLTLKTFRISDYCYDQQDDKLINLFSDLLRTNLTLREVYFYGDRISPNGFSQFVDVIRNHNKKICITTLDDNDHVNKSDPLVISAKEELEKLLSRNSRLRNVRQAATMLAQASRDDDCLFNTIPKELLPVIAGLTASYNKTRTNGYGFHPFSLFLFTKEEESQEDVISLTEAQQKFRSENARKGK